MRAQAYSDAIWHRWLKEFVPSLNRRSKWSSPPKRQLKTGDLVWIIKPTSPRGHYPQARVVKLNFGSNSVARSAEVKTSTGLCLVRPVVKLCPVLPAPDPESFSFQSPLPKSIEHLTCSLNIYVNRFLCISKEKDFPFSFETKNHHLLGPGGCCVRNKIERLLSNISSK